MNAPQSFSDFIVVVREFMQVKIFEINQTPITPSSLVMFVLVILAFFVASRIVNRGILKRILGRFAIEPGIQYNMVRVGHYAVMAIGAIVAFQFVGLDLSGLAVIFGLLSVGIGFGLQNVTSNFIAGLILLFERPIKVGDRVTVGDTEGDVESISMRSTTIKSLNNISIIVPNSEFISNSVINWSHGDPKLRLDIEVGVSYSSDPDLVMKVLLEVAAEHPDILDLPRPDVLLNEFGDSSWNMKLRAWVAHAKRFYQIRSEINCAIVRKFRANAIEIPFPQRDLHVRTPMPFPVRTEGH